MRCTEVVVVEEECEWGVRRREASNVAESLYRVVCVLAHALSRITCTICNALVTTGSLVYLPIIVGYFLSAV